jgi:allantoin racemase
MRILVINVNTSESMTATIVTQARSVASPDTVIIGATPSFGPASVESVLESHLAAVGVLDVAVRKAADCDAVVLAGFGDLGREALQELLVVPVVDITDAAAHVASLLGHTFAVVTTLQRSVPSIVQRLASSGLQARCVAVRATEIPVLDLERDPQSALEAMIVAANLAIRQDGAEVICLGCAGMTDLREAMSKETGVPVVDGVTAAVALAEALHRLGLRTSKAGVYAPSPVKAIAGWPLSGPPDLG